MCLEDLRLGRKRFSKTAGQTVVNAGTLTTAANGRRVAILFTANGTGNCRVDSEQAGVANMVTVLTPQFPTYELFVERHGNLVERRFVITNLSIASTDIGVTETLTDDT